MAPLKDNDLYRLLTELKGYCAGGAPIPESLKLFAETSDDGALKAIALYLAAETSKGIALSTAMKSAPQEFPSDIVAMIECGENSGNLPGMLDFILDHIQRKQRYVSDVVNAAIYPTGIVAILIIILMIVGHYVVPGYMESIRLSRLQLSPEKMLGMKMLGSFGTPIGLIFLTILEILTIGLLIALIRNKLSQKTASLLPGVGGLIRKGDHITLMSFVANLTKRGVPLGDIFRAASRAMNMPENVVAAQEMARASDQGNTVAVHLPDSFPATAAWLFSRGEQRGNLSETAHEITRYCEEQYDLSSRRIAVMIEPLLLLCISVLLVAILISLYMPIFYNIGQALKES